MTYGTILANNRVKTDRATRGRLREWRCRAATTEPFRLLATTVAVGATISLLGCDIGYGVRRSARLARPIDVSCVPRALERVPGVTDVTHRHVESSTSAWVDQFIFSGDNIWGVVSVSVDYDQTAELAMYHMELNRKPPQDVIDQTREAMDVAEPLLQDECKDLLLASKLKEWCRGVMCDEPADKP